MRRLLIALILIAACGPAQAQSRPSELTAMATPAATPTIASTPSPATSASPSPSASPSHRPLPLLFAVLEAKGAHAPSLTNSPTEWNTVAIAGLDGYARAKTTFTPMPVPNVGCFSPVLPRSAYVAAGRVYFADGKGVVRTLSAQGKITNIATFPLTSRQQMLSFAVSPDGSRLLAAVFTLPPEPTTGCHPPVSTGYRLDVYSARPGRTSTLIYHANLANTDVMAFVGWDQVGPVATYPSVWASPGVGLETYNGIPVRVDPTTGKVLKQVSNPGFCAVSDIGASGDFTCALTGSANISIRRPDGSEIWRFRGGTPDYFNLLSPNENNVVEEGDAGVAVIGRDQSGIKLGGGFNPLGWLDSATVMGQAWGSISTGPGHLGVVKVSATSKLVDLGFTGLFLGTVQS